MVRPSRLCPRPGNSNWADTVDIAQAVDRAGMEALLPVGRWRGYGGPSDFNCTTFESFTWAVGARRADQIRDRTRHMSRAAGASVDGGEDGVDHRSRHRRAVCAQCRLRLVQERVRHVRRPDAPARRPLQIRRRMARIFETGLDRRQGIRLRQRELSRPQCLEPAEAAAKAASAGDECGRLAGGAGFHHALLRHELRASSRIARSSKAPASRSPI